MQSKSKIPKHEAKVVRFDIPIRLKETVVEDGKTTTKVVSILEAVGRVENNVIQIDLLFKGQQNIITEMKLTGGAKVINRYAMAYLKKLKVI